MNQRVPADRTYPAVCRERLAGWKTVGGRMSDARSDWRDTYRGRSAELDAP